MPLSLTRRGVLLLPLGLLVASPAHAIFGAGDIVYDPTNYLFQVKQWAQQLKDNFDMLRQTKDMLTNTTTLLSVLDEGLASPRELVGLVMDIGEDARSIYGDVSNLQASLSRLQSGGSIPKNIAQQFITQHYAAIGQTFGRASDVIDREEKRGQTIQAIVAKNKAVQGSVESNQLAVTALATLANQLQDLNRLQAQQAQLHAQLQLQSETTAVSAKDWAKQRVQFAPAPNLDVTRIVP